jgi:adenine-specific DNA glycosylase
VVNGGFWELPNTEGEDAVSLSRRIPVGEPGQLERIGTIRHTITRYRIELTGYAMRVEKNGQSKRPGNSERWVTERELDRLPFVSAHRKLLRLWRDRNRC